MANSSVGIAIALAWPETFCKQPGSWYDGIMNTIGVSKNHYYQVGHSAIVLINGNGDCKYFDFGRYHSPFGMGRVRDEVTDHELRMKSKGEITHTLGLVNYSEILKEIHNNKACHGEGYLAASYCKVDFLKAFDFAKSVQEKSPLPYGPFVIGGTNCSRFVKDVLHRGNPHITHKIKLHLTPTITPSPISNVKALTNKLILRNER